jgi:large subunit ribosomal protein L7/L12
MADVSREQVKDFIKNMSLMEAATLVKELETELGVSAAAPVMAAMPGAGAAAGAAPAEEKDEFTVVLKTAGDKKIQVNKAEAETIAKKLEEAGGQVEVK